MQNEVVAFKNPLEYKQRTPLVRPERRISARGMAHIAVFFSRARNKGRGKDDLIYDGSCKGCAVLPSLSRPANRLGSTSKNLQDEQVLLQSRGAIHGTTNVKIYQQEILTSRCTVLTSVVDP